MNKLVEECLLIGVQMGERGTIWGLLVHPEWTMCRQRLAIHQKGACVWEPAPQTIEHRKAMGVDVAPVIDMCARHPRCGLQKVNAVAQAEDNDGFDKVGKCQTVDLVFGDKDMARSNIQRSKIADRNRQVGQAE